MFSPLQRNSSTNQFLTFAGSLCAQAAVLLLVISQGYAPMMSGPSLHKQAAHATVTPIYFQPDTPTAANIPDPAPTVAVQPAPEVVSKAKAEKADVEQASNTDSAASDGSASGDSDGQGLAPFASWSMNSNSRGFAMFHHQIKTALPVFTPDPPILHGKFPEPARGRDIVVEIVINDQGSIVQATVLQGIGYGVEDMIMETLRTWIFVPAKVNGMAIVSKEQLRFHFPS